MSGGKRISSSVQKEVYTKGENRKATAALWQTERRIDIQHLCNLYSDSEVKNDDDNDGMHEDHNQTRHGETPLTSSSVHDDHGQEQSEGAALTSSSGDDYGMVGIWVRIFIKNVF